VALKVKKVKGSYQFILKEEIMKGKQMDSYKINLHGCGRTGQVQCFTIGIVLLMAIKFSTPMGR